MKEEGQVLGSLSDEGEWVQPLMMVVHVVLQTLLVGSAEVLTVFLEREWMVEVGSHQYRHHYVDSGQVRLAVGEPLRVRARARARDLGLG